MGFEWGLTHLEPTFTPTRGTSNVWEVRGSQCARRRGFTSRREGKRWFLLAV